MYQKLCHLNPNQTILTSQLKMMKVMIVILKQKWLAGEENQKNNFPPNRVKNAVK